MVPPQDSIIEEGDYDDELLIIARGSARTKRSDKQTDIFTESVLANLLFFYCSHQPCLRVPRFEVGSFFGELEFLGISEKRSLAVVAKTFCEMAAIAPTAIQNILLSNPNLKRRLESYGSMRKTVEDKMTSGEAFDIDEVRNVSRAYAAMQAPHHARILYRCV